MIKQSFVTLIIVKFCLLHPHLFQALHIDFKEIGRGCIPEDINRGKCESMPGNVVLMVTKIRNVAAPKVKEDSGAAPRMLKISLTDGIMTCHAVEVSECKGPELQQNFFDDFGRPL